MKTTDILCIGGVRNNVLVNAPVPVERYIEFPFAGGTASYTTSQHAGIDGKRYWIATPTGFDPPDYTTIDAAILAREHKPAWDLREPMPTPQV